MSQGKSTINSFNDGMVQDIDILNTRNSAYRYSMNGRLMFNKNGTYSWETENGSKISFVIEARGGLDNTEYKVIGNTGNDNIRVLFSVSITNGAGEIGLFSIDEAGVGSYKTLFNDQDDPNGDSLNFLTKNQIEARFIYENDKCIRTYWVDGVADDSNRPRTITFSYDPNLGNPSNVNAYSGTNLSVHAMNSQADFRMGLIKYVRNIGGALITGVYQYTYRLRTKDGYNTPFYPLTRRVFVCNSAIDSFNWNEYEMNSSGLQSAVGNLIEVKGIDQRFDEIHVAYTLVTSGNTIADSKIFAQTNIISDVMQFNHVSNVGEPLLPEEIADLFSGIQGAKTLNVKDSTLYFGNIKENLIDTFDLEPILQNVTIKPKFKDMRSDEWANTSGVSLAPPLTHGWPRTGITQMRQHSAPGGVEDYTINNDYLNYKGTQIDHLYGGYFRGETYRLALVVRDLLGFRSFAFHLADFRFPDQSERFYNYSRVKADGTVVYKDGVLNERAWPTNNYNHASLSGEKVFVGDDGGNLPPMDTINPNLGANSPGAKPGEKRAVSHLRIMGLDISGLDLSSIADRISGFEIVRVKRDATILVQGLILPTVGINDDDDGPIISPLPSTHQDFYDFTLGSPPVPTSIPADIKLNEPFAFGANPNDRFHIRPNISVLYAPSVDFGSTSFPAAQSQDQLVLVGGCFDEYQSNQAIIYRASWDYMWYGKAYYTKNNWHLGPQDGNPADTGNQNSAPYFSSDPFPRYMARTNVSKVTNLGIRGQVPQWTGGLQLNNDLTVDNGDERRAHGKENSIYLLHGNYNHSSGPGNFPHSSLYKNIEPVRQLSDRGQNNNGYEFMGGFICNYVRPNPNPYGGLTLSSLEQSIFIGTGHFQPINNPTFDAQGMPANLVFDNIEVFGGDCYLDYHSFLRTYPHSGWNGASDNDDFSDARVFPLEYEYNHSMREAGSQGGSGPSLIWANVGARPAESISNANSQAAAWNEGLYSGAPNIAVLEQFHLNATMAFEELLIFFNPKPINFKDNSRYPVRWRYTREKVYGDPVDNWRLYQVNDFRDLNGEYGEITSSLYIFNQIYSWQISAFGRLRASDRALIESQQGGTLSTGIGDKLDGVDYTSTEFGNQHQWSLFGSDRAAYWMDVNKRKWMKFAQDGKNPISDIKGIHQYLELELPLFEDNDNPVNNLGIHGAFDYGNNEAVMTFNRNRVINPDENNAFTLVSRHLLGKTFSPYIINQNETAIINPLISNSPVFLPIGNVGIGVNENTLMYLSVQSGLVNADVYNADDNGVTLLFTAQPGIFYRLFRSSISEPWQYEEVNADDATPHSSSLTYNEFGDYFQGFHSYAPTHYIETKFLLVSHDAIGNYSPINTMYVHDMGLKGDFPAFSKKSVLGVSVNEGSMVAKVWDSVRLNCNEDYANYLDTVVMETENQMFMLDMKTDSRKAYKENVLRFPLRAEEQPSRMRGKHILLTLEMKNNSLYNDRITNLVTYYRPSQRM